jgi:hypothetical protein
MLRWKGTIAEGRRDSRASHRPGLLV